jgi:hypothetical protein
LPNHCVTCCHDWTSRCQGAFEKLKGLLTTARIMQAPDWSLPFELMCCCYPIFDPYFDKFSNFQINKINNNNNNNNKGLHVAVT